MNFVLKRIFAAFCAFLMLAPMLTACNDGEGLESSEQSDSEGSQEEALAVITVGDNEYTLRDAINSQLCEDGVYIYTREIGKPAAPKADNDDRFFDIAVLDGIVVEVGDKCSTAVIPEDGFVVRFRGVDAEVNIGDKVEFEGLDLTVYPESYIKFGDIYIEIGYKNTERTAEDTGWLYDEYWYTGITENNEHCTEIAVQNGKIVEINRSGDAVAGISIPEGEGGFVLAVGEDSVNERKSNKLRVGDEAVLVESEKLYTSKRFNIAGSDTDRANDGIVLFTDEKRDTTPVGNNLTELAVNSDGRITAIYENCSGMNKIPKGGFVVSATGLTAQTLARTAVKEALVIKHGPRNIRIVTTPMTELSRLMQERDAILDSYKSAVDKLERIDFEAVAEIISEMSGCISRAEATLGISDSEGYCGYDGALLAEEVNTLTRLAKVGRTELIPYITVQDRMAWVTVGEYNYSNQIVLHYTTQADVDHTVKYAKLCGLNTLIIDNTVGGFAVYESKVEGMVRYPKFRDFDIIEAFKRACDANGIRLIVMVNSFQSGLEGVYYPENHYMSIYKDKYLLTNKGRYVGPDKVITLDPADKEVQEFNLAVIAEIAEKYDIYGVQADYMRYPLPYYYQEHNYEDFGYNESSALGFIKKYGKDPAKLKITDPLWEKWCAWRRDIISDYQKRFYQTVKAINPNLQVSFTCFADYRDRQIFVYQDVEKWAENGYADAIFPMIYGETTEYQQGYAEEILPITEHTQLVLGVGTYVKATRKSIEEQLIMPYSLCAEGVSVFTLRYINTCGYGETFRNAFRVEATPASADGAELVAASAEMISQRISSLLYAARFSGGLEEAEGESLKSLGEEIKSLGDTSDSFGSFCESLSATRTDIESGEIPLPEAVKDAILAELDYIISLN